MTPITVAIAGGTGKLGSRRFPTAQRCLITQVSDLQESSLLERFCLGSLTPARSSVLSTHSSTVISHSQGTSSSGRGVYDGDITPKTLEGVGAVANALGMAASREINDNLARAASEAGVKVYIPNEFGLDMRPLGHYGKPWAIRSSMSTYARELYGGAMKVISVYPGTFLDLIFPMA
ncbi:hypothetical protein FRC00_006992, partial [Tulasnella sp. 408]